ncbi:hypothetical protein ACP70R_011054 [Stipagrostis hirtigluma subsp. patula]
MCPLDVEAGGIGSAADAAAGIAEATHDAAKLRRALVAGGVGQAAAALYMALFKPPAGMFLRGGGILRRSYYGVLVAVVLFGVAEAWAGLWVSHDPRRRRAAGVAVLWASVLPLLLLAGVGGLAILK